MGTLTPARLQFLDFADNPDILAHIQDRCVQKKLEVPPGLLECEQLYRANLDELHERVNFGVKTELPPENVWLMTLKGLRKEFDTSQLGLESLNIIVVFDDDENLAVKYIVNQEESLEAWASKHPEFDIEQLREILNSYLLEDFEKNGLELLDNKLYHKNTNKPITYQEFQKSSVLNDFRGLRSQLLDAKIARSIDVSTERAEPPKPGMDVQQSV